MGIPGSDGSSGLSAIQKKKKQKKDNYDSDDLFGDGNDDQRERERESKLIYNQSSGSGLISGSSSSLSETKRKQSGSGDNVQTQQTVVHIQEDATHFDHESILTPEIKAVRKPPTIKRHQSGNKQQSTPELNNDEHSTIKFNIAGSNQLKEQSNQPLPIQPLQKPVSQQTQSPVPVQKSKQKTRNPLFDDEGADDLDNIGTSTKKGAKKGKKGKAKSNNFENLFDD
ncbi:MAG: hypothetical protein EZS28_025356 [Streblomastix strix]|uniref:Uncharacterized protein n=1 Tax=Streblomastix strix TaxID=222440 RepID=A0A5J4V9A0_9EUKA|nr:MAG: hypothetical protein EZS28_025356 [Streblomastix strix]